MNIARPAKNLNVVGAYSVALHTALAVAASNKRQLLSFVKGTMFRSLRKRDLREEIASVWLGDLDALKVISSCETGGHRFDLGSKRIGGH